MPRILSELYIILAGKLTFTLLICNVWVAGSKAYCAETPCLETLPALPSRSMPKPDNFDFKLVYTDSFIPAYCALLAIVLKFDGDVLFRLTTGKVEVVNQ